MKAYSIEIQEHFISDSQEKRTRNIQQQAKIYVEMMLESQRDTAAFAAEKRGESHT